MQCSKCHSEAVITQPYSGLSLCLRHLIADIDGKAKKEIRKAGGLARGEKIYLAGLDDFRLFALRIFVSGLFAKRTDIIFVKDAAEATTIFTSETLDDKAAGLLDAVLCGNTVSYLTVPPKRTVSPLSVIPEEEVYLYAKAHNWNGEAPTPSPTKKFLNEFSANRPGTKYAVKNTADFLENYHDV